MINKHTELCLAVKRPTRFKVTLFTRCSRSSLRNEEYIRCAFREDGEGKKPHFKKSTKKERESSFDLWNIQLFRNHFRNDLQEIRFRQTVYFLCVLQVRGITEKAARSWKPDGGDPARAGFQQNIN